MLKDKFRFQENSTQLKHLSGFRRNTALIPLLLLLGCSVQHKDDSPVSPSAPQNSDIAEEILGQNYILDSAEGFEPVQDSTISVSFSGNSAEEFQFSLRTGCNGMSGDLTIKDELLIIKDADITERGCDEELHIQDDWLVSFFEANPAIELDDDQMILSDGDSSLIFNLDVPVEEPDSQLTENTWKIYAFGFETSGDDMIYNFFLSPSPYLVFDEAGSFQVHTGCTEGEGDFISQSNEITISNITLDENECVDSDAQLVHDSIVEIMESGVVEYSINGTELHIIGDSMSLYAQTL